MKIIKNIFKSVCCFCGKAIIPEEHPFKIKYNNRTLHLLCFYKWLNKKIELLQKKLLDLRKFKKQVNKHKTQIMLETLDSN